MGAVVASFAGCGPIEYVNEVTRKASTEVDAAKAVAVEDDAHFRYWYTLAVEYLKKAREEASYADFQAANRFGRESSFAAKKARETAIRSAADPSSMVRTPALDEGVGATDDGSGFSDLGGDDAVPADDGSDDENPLAPSGDDQ